MCKKRKIITISVLFVLALTVSYLQWGREIDVAGSMRTSSENFHEEHVTFNAGSYVTHVGILVSPTQMYHAGDPIGYADLSSSYWQQHLIGAGRVKQ